MQSSTNLQLNTYWQWRGHKIHFVKAGKHQQNPPLLLVHGFGASTDHWHKNIAELQENFEVWAIDLIGFGRSAKPNIEYNSDLWQDQLHNFITEVIGRPAILAGNSIGGYVALCTAAHHSQSVAGLILINCAGDFSSLEVTNANSLQRLISKMAISFLLQPFPNFLLFQHFHQKSVIRKILQSVYLDQSAIGEQLVEDIYRPSCDSGAPQVFAAVFQASRGDANDVLLAKISCPLLTIWGEGDPWMNVPQLGKEFKKHYPKLIEHYLHAGHCPHDEVPGQVNELIRQWVKRLTWQRV